MESHVVRYPTATRVVNRLVQLTAEDAPHLLMERDGLQLQIKALEDRLVVACDDVGRITKERDEADCRAGAAEREMVGLKEDAFQRQNWLRKAKREAGYADSISFDVVWKDMLEESQREILLQILRDYPKGQDDGSWIRRVEVVLSSS